ncbi:tRNA methyltransferase [Baekduia alba]|uniref:class I SAM-dependent methyltransferase n=1 Tax=Baekduia alba TaxID=2997333 RepID=UPI002341882E|nr:methyltransferase domain-containing protein [Baekduia alba]WCB95011.1 tRNA methyltransferase [Baekduia alba]
MDDASGRPREWDAGSYHGLAQPHQQWGAQILDRLPLRGDETVLDLGCGTGRVTAQLLERLGPDGRALGIDGSAQMVEEAARRLGDDPRASFEQQDLVELAVAPPADAAVSSATFHWIADHDRLFARVRGALVEGAPFVAQCGGRGNVAHVVRAIEEVSAREPYAPSFAGWPGPWNYAEPEETTARLERAGFAVERCWLEPSPQYPEPLREFLRTVSLGSHLQRLPDALHDGFVDAVAEAMEPDPVHDYVRLNIVARAV